ncbi:MAG: DHH family phosphoesterase [Candidatus Cloacimonetes bacterium]|nr:DHH family phosphoesterase [Candidatus Cloacimonadota bacterium]
MGLRWSYFDKLDCSIVDQIKKNRNLPDSFFSFSMNDIPDISLMKDIKKASERIIRAIHRKEKIIIYGHDDVDGITSAYILFDFLEKIGSQNHYYYIPNRLVDNHGMQENFINKVEKENFNLVITVDGGISCSEAIEKLRNLGCDVIVTDHHIVQENKIPKGCAIVNPKQSDCDYPFDMLAGVGVTYFLIRNIAEILKSEIDSNYLFWVAVGTISDKVPLIGVNRIIVKETIKNWFDFDDATLRKFDKYLWNADNCHKKIKIIQYIIKIFSNGRDLNGKNMGLELLLAPEDEKTSIIDKLISGQRKFKENLNKVMECYDKIKPESFDNHFVFFDSKNIIPVELLGFFSARISKQFLIPVVFLKEKGNIVAGEARCTKGFNLVESFCFCKQNLIQYGGHAKAAGFTIKKKNINKFRKKFKEYIEMKKEIIEDNRKIDIDAIFTIDEIDKFDDYLQLDIHNLQPFGQGNPNPKFLLKNFIPKRDSRKIKVIDKNIILKPDESYNIIFNLKGSSFKLIDHRKVNYML